MDEHRDPQTNAPDEGELLAAYLDAETDDLTSARLERLLQQDPQAAARLDALARTRERLQRLDEVAPHEGFRERLDARLAAERTPSQVTQSQRTAAPGDAGRVQAGARATQRWFAPFAAAAALVLVAVIGGAALLGQTGSGEDSAAAPAPLQAESSGAADAPMAEADDGAGSGEERAGAPASGAQSEVPAGAEEEQAANESSASAPPRVTSDAGIAARLRRSARITDDAAARESELRERAGLATAPVCLADTDATAVDLVELDGRPVIAALTGSGDEQDVVLFDARSCERLRRFPAE
jgi:negative regulator of sigma E activity